MPTVSDKPTMGKKLAMEPAKAAPSLRCQRPLEGEEKPCGALAWLARSVDGTMHKVCLKHAVEIEEQREPDKGPTDPLRPTPEEREEEERMFSARWDADQMKLRPGKRRTLDQAVAEEEADMGRAIQRTARASRKGGR